VPAQIIPADSVNTDGYHCTGPIQKELRVLQQQMEEGLDYELGRILVETGIASYNADWSLNYDPESSNTLIVIVGDNGTFGPAVNPPFDGSRAKATPYQTGVWVPLIAAGPMVKSPGRQVSAMVNGVDLYKLFTEIAGIDADKVVPKAQRLDAVRMLSYLTQPKSKAIRKTNLTQTGENVRLPELREYTPCVLGPPYNGVTLFFPRKAICEKNGGTWYGPGSSVAEVPPEGLRDGCAVNEFRVNTQMLPPVTVDQSLKTAIREDNYKLVELVELDCDTEIPREITTTMEFYRIDEKGPTPLLDREANNLLKDSGVDDLTREEQRVFGHLARQLGKWKDTIVTSCPGDGNLDLVVDEKDLEGYYRFATGTGTGDSSWYDFDLDGNTDAADLDIIDSHFGQRCKPENNASVK
jgi:hypothetical protein